MPKDEFDPEDPLGWIALSAGGVGAALAGTLCQPGTQADRHAWVAVLLGALRGRAGGFPLFTTVGLYHGHHHHRRWRCQQPSRLSTGNNRRKHPSPGGRLAAAVRRIYRMALNGVDNRGPMGLKSIATWLNENNIRTRDGGRWGLGAVHQVLTRTTYIGEHRFNTRSHKDREKKPESEVAIMAVPVSLPSVAAWPVPVAAAVRFHRCPAIAASLVAV